jgi:hypothetical protein
MSDLIYLACPYSHYSYLVREFRFQQANRYASKLMQAGLLVFSPISHTHPIAERGDLPKGWDYWERYDRAYMEISRAVVVLCIDGWKDSVGVAAEITIAGRLELPVLYLEPNNDDSLRAVIRALGGTLPEREDQ